MNNRIMLVLVFTVSLIFAGRGMAFSQEHPEKNAQAPAPEVSPGSSIPQAVQTPQMQWVWGEAVSVDAQNKTVVVKYLDYESDQEKDLAITADEMTTYENIKSVDQIKVKDALSIDYVVTADGKNIAKNISLEKVEEQPMPQPSDIPQAEVPIQAAPDSAANPAP